MLAVNWQNAVPQLFHHKGNMKSLRNGTTDCGKVARYLSKSGRRASAQMSPRSLGSWPAKPSRFFAVKAANPYAKIAYLLPEGENYKLPSLFAALNGLEIT